MPNLSCRVAGDGPLLALLHPVGLDGSLWEAVAEHDALGRLPALDIPTLVIAGETDLATPLEAKRALAAAIPASRLVVLPDAPHMMQIECAEPFQAAVMNFLESHRSGKQDGR